MIGVGVGGITALGHHTFKIVLAAERKEARSILRVKVLHIADVGIAAVQHLTENVLAFHQRTPAQIVAIQPEQIKGVKIRRGETAAC
jgi:hypothetical protein